jgi:hypothetical protein
MQDPWNWKFGVCPHITKWHFRNKLQGFYWQIVTFSFRLHKIESIKYGKISNFTDPVDGFKIEFDHFMFASYVVFFNFINQRTVREFYFGSENGVMLQN